MWVNKHQQFKITDFIHSYDVSSEDPTMEPGCFHKIDIGFTLYYFFFSRRG